MQVLEIQAHFSDFQPVVPTWLHRQLAQQFGGPRDQAGIEDLLPLGLARRLWMRRRGGDGTACIAHAQCLTVTLRRRHFAW